MNRSKGAPRIGAVRSNSTSYVWRRLHGGSIIAQVSQLRGMGSWLVAAIATWDDAQSITLQQAEAQALARFDRDDLNHDGVVTAAERQQARAALKAARAAGQNPGQ